MVWTEKSVVEQRLEFVMLASLQGANVSQLCERFGISRKTGYKWLGRFKAQEPEGSLADASRRPRSSPQRCAAALEAQVVGLRTEHPAWGGRKIAHVLQRDHGGQLAASTVTSILRRHQLIDRRASEAATPWQRFEHVAPNNLWQMDFKGHFALARGRCHPLTVLDDHSRYNIVLQACSNEQGATVKAALQEVFRRYGLPARINTDNGQPWGDARQHLTSLGAWLVRLGIRVSHSTPMHPQTNGKDERFHRTLKAEVLRGRSFADIEQCQQAFERWRAVYNTRRPHEALQMKTPVQRYQPSNLSYPEVLPNIEYAPSDKVRRVDKAGRISIAGASVFISNALHAMPVGLRQSIEDADGLDVFFCHQRIKTLWLSELQ